jgi:pimeloyl-ACP methyl ester carboxylesterase
MKMNKRVEYLPALPEGSAEAECPQQTSALLELVRVGFGTAGRLFPLTAARIAYQLFSTPRVRAKHSISDDLLESARLFEFLYGRQVLKGYEWGKGEQVVLLVHGWESRGTALRSFVPSLVEKGYRVVAFDGPAHGNSDGKRTNIVHFAGAVRAIIRQIGGVHSIITHSFGGASTVYALSNANPAIEVEKLVLIGVPNRMTRVLNEAAATMKLPTRVKKRFWSLLEKKLGTSLDQADLSKAAGRVNVKDLLIIHDRFDPVVAFHSAEEIHEAWENSTLLISEGYGHYRLMKNPDLIRRVTEFIDVYVTVPVR